ncbi:RNA polymerase sigma factor [Paenibacillus contaminans]|uniref:RNA polymerase sigma factor n=1 Tax=Paenibacillus contaminans TaxID=450362 RepID=UPI001EDDEB8E|nr:sigma-70 family RNA polymerase sigma factor [Paenibacillus contaminans]
MWTNDAELTNVETEHNFEELEDSILVQRAQTGDWEAFGELIRRHRRQMYGYAQVLTQEPFLAEDIVQDALIRAFLHLGTLVDVARFLPWLHRIVRNQAYTRLRSNAVVKEMPFSVLQHNGEQRDSGGSVWSNLDDILHRVSRSFAENANTAANPEERFIRRQLHEMITSMLSCLTKRERQIFESHFFDHLSPQEIAKLFSLSPANVYQILSRSRKKVAKERIRIVVDQYMMERKDLGALKTNLLTKTAAFHSPGTWTSAGWALYRMLSFTDRKLSLPMVMGLTGQAFRITICHHDVHIAGPTMYPFRDILPRGLTNIGWSCRIVETKNKRDVPGDNINLIDPSLLEAPAKEKRLIQEELPAALDLIHRSIDRGIPVLSWDLFIPEFGVIYGYDDERRMLTAMECVQDDKLPYDHLGRGTLEDLFILALEERTEKDQRSMLRDALAMILDHYHGREAATDRGERGLRAYDVWMEAFHSGNIEPNGNAYSLAVLQDARRFAADFLDEISKGRQGGDPSDERIRVLGTEAAQLYRQMAEQLQELVLLFPFPSGGDPNLMENRNRLVNVLQEVKALEEQVCFAA